MNNEPTCVSRHTGDHVGAPEYDIVLVSQITGEDLNRIGPVCKGHAEYEQRWSAAAGAAAQVRIEPRTEGNL